MVDAALSSVNKLIGLLNDFHEAREEVQIQLKKTQILATALKQGLISRMALNGKLYNGVKKENKGKNTTKNKSKKQQKQDETETVDAENNDNIDEDSEEQGFNNLISKDQVMVNLKNSIEQAFKILKDIRQRSCFTSYFKAKSDLHNIKESYDMLETAYSSLEKEMQIIESAKQQRMLKKQLNEAQIMYQNLTSVKAKQFIESYFRENFHSIKMAELSKKFIEYVQNENLRLKKEDKFPLINLEPEFQKIIGGNPESVDLGRINNFFENIWENESNKNAFKSYLIDQNANKIDEYLFVFQILEQCNMKQYFQLFKQYQVKSNLFLSLNLKSLQKGFGSKITPEDACIISLQIQEIKDEIKYYEDIRSFGNQTIERCKDFVASIVAKKNQGRLVSVNYEDWKENLGGQLSPPGKLIHLLCESKQGNGGLYIETDEVIIIGFFLAKTVTSLYPVFRQKMKYQGQSVKLTSYLSLDACGQLNGISYVRKQETGNDLKFQEQYLKISNSTSQGGEWKVDNELMHGITVDTKTQTTLYGDYAYNDNGECLVHGRQIQKNFKGVHKFAYFYIGTELSYQEYKEIFDIQQQGQMFLERIQEKSVSNSNTTIKEKQQSLDQEKQQQTAAKIIDSERVIIK